VLSRTPLIIRTVDQIFQLPTQPALWWVLGALFVSSLSFFNFPFSCCFELFGPVYLSDL
jgi:hypothetical protein